MKRLIASVQEIKQAVQDQAKAIHAQTKRKGSSSTHPQRYGPKYSSQMR